MSKIKEFLDPDAIKVFEDNALDVQGKMDTFNARVHLVYGGIAYPKQRKLNSQEVQTIIDSVRDQKTYQEFRELMGL